MQVWRHSLETAPEARPCSAAMGIFDGIHQGHQQLLRAAIEGAKKRNIQSAVVTFDPHPSVVVAPEHRPQLLMTLAQRLEAFERSGMDLAWVIPFSRDFSELSPDFFLAHLKRVLSPKELHVGTGFHFGHRRMGDIEVLRSWGSGSGCDVHGHALRAPDGGALSSTRIRRALNAGYVEEAAVLLGHPFVLTGIVVEGERRGRHLGFPTANLAWEQEQLPSNGVYVTEVRCSHFEGPRQGMTNVGEKPTFAGSRLTVETFLPDFEGDLYGSRLDLRFLHRLRPEQKFNGVEALRAQIAEDVLQGQRWWKEHRSEA